VVGEALGESRCVCVCVCVGGGGIGQYANNRSQRTMVKR
jgi:hypothetical protein